MRTPGSSVRERAGWLGALGTWALLAQAAWGAGDAPKAAARDQWAAGREIFHREWLAGDSRSHGGDGLGPVYNDTSCIACHNSGGAGGAGPVNKNIDILSASRNLGGLANPMVPPAMNGTTVARPGAVPTPAVGGGNPAAPNTDALFNLHAGFRSGRTVVLHRFGTDPNYESWRRTLLLGSPPVGDAMLMLRPPSPAPQAFLVPAPPVIEGRAPNPQALDEPKLEPVPPPVATTTASVQMVESNTLATPGPVPAMGLPFPLTDIKTTTVDVPADRAMRRFQEMRAELLVAIPGGARTPVFAGEFKVTRSQRNPTPLFGLGLIDAIPEAAIEAAAARRSEKFPEVQGRVSRLKDGRVGRLGWKGQTANSEDFVLTACAVELGLEVPGHAQAVSPQAPKYRAGGMDLTAEECSALVAYVRHLPRPIERLVKATEESRAIAAGKALFSSVGCASCHSPSLGDVEGIYSDLSLHDMGSELADMGSYNGGSEDDSDPLNPVLDVARSDGPGMPQASPRRDAPATRQEWRTPPLWGVRDSAPYLHDGRAQTFDQAVAGHGGQGGPSAQRYFALTPRERLQVEAFLKSLVAPSQDGE